MLSEFSDDIGRSAFQCTIAVAPTRSSYLVKVTAKTSNKDLRGLIDAGSAAYAVHVECAPTRYRNLAASPTERFEFEIPASLIDGRVEVCSFVLASKALDKYVNRDFHPDYQGHSFRVRDGDVLAVAPDQSFIAEKKVDPLRQIPSIFVIVPNEDPGAPVMDIETTGHKIRVALSRRAYENYKILRNAQPMHSTLNSMVIGPALIATLEEIRAAGQGGGDGLIEYESRRWYSTLRRRLIDMRVDPANPDSFTESSPTLAQQLIGEPLDVALSSLRGYEEEEDANEGDD